MTRPARSGRRRRVFCVAPAFAAMGVPVPAVWAQEQTLTASNGAAGDFFGMPIAISGNTLVVRAPGDDVTVANQGSVRVFVRNGGVWRVSLTNGVWTERQKLTASDGVTGDGRGFSVEIRGNELLVGTHLDTVAGNTFQGSVRVFSPSPVAAPSP